MPGFKYCQRQASCAHMQIPSAYLCFRCSCVWHACFSSRHSKCPLLLYAAHCALRNMATSLPRAGYADAWRWVC